MKNYHFIFLNLLDTYLVEVGKCSQQYFEQKRKFLCFDKVSMHKDLPVLQRTVIEKA